MNIDLSTDAPPSPERTLQLAETFAEIARVMNHVTRHHEALQYPSEADRLIRELASAAARLPQLCGQVSRWTDHEEAAGRIVMAPGQYEGNPGLAAELTRIHLDAAASYFSAAQRELAAAASVTNDMAAPEPGDG